MGYRLHCRSARVVAVGERLGGDRVRVVALAVAIVDCATGDQGNRSGVLDYFSQCRYPTNAVKI